VVDDLRSSAYFAINKVVPGNIDGFEGREIGEGEEPRPFSTLSVRRDVVLEI
jgi:hypothetical protein